MFKPIIDMMGYFEVSSPFSLLPNTTYKCVAIRDFSDLKKAGIDPFKQFYEPVGLIEGTDGFSIVAEQTNGVKIISLQDSAGNIVFVPTSYVVKAPAVDHVPYSDFAISLYLGSLPDETDLGTLMQHLSEEAQRLLGIPSVLADVHAMTVTNPPTFAEHTLSEQARLAAIGFGDDNSSKLVQEQARVLELQEKVNLLTQKLIDAGLTT